MHCSFQINALGSSFLSCSVTHWRNCIIWHQTADQRRTPDARSFNTRALLERNVTYFARWGERPPTLCFAILSYLHRGSSSSFFFLYSSFSPSNIVILYLGTYWHNAQTHHMAPNISAGHHAKNFNTRALLERNLCDIFCPLRRGLPQYVLPYFLTFIVDPSTSSTYFARWGERPPTLCFAILSFVYCWSSSFYSYFSSPNIFIRTHG